MPRALHRQWAAETWRRAFRHRSLLVCTEKVGSKVKSKGLGLGTDEFCSITELAINASALQARLSLLVSSPASSSFLNFLMPHAFEAIELAPLH